MWTFRSLKGNLAKGGVEIYEVPFFVNPVKAILPQIHGGGATVNHLEEIITWGHHGAGMMRVGVLMSAAGEELRRAAAVALLNPAILTCTIVRSRLLCIHFWKDVYPDTSS